jgi:hypothetical protein
MEAAATGSAILSGLPTGTVVSYQKTDGSTETATVPGDQPFQLDNIPAGKQKLVFQNSSWPSQVELPVEITTGTIIPVQCKMKKLVLSGLPPETEVYLENKKYGVTAADGADLVAGSFYPADYKIKLLGPFIQTVEQNISLQTKDDTVLLKPAVQVSGVLRVKEDPVVNNGSLIMAVQEGDKPGADGTELPAFTKSTECLLKPGIYTVTFRHTEDKEAGFSSTVQIKGGTYTDLTLPEVAWSIPYQLDKLNAQRTACINRLQKADGERKAAHITGWTALGLGAVSGAVATYAYIQGKNAYSEYNNAYYGSDQDFYKSQAEMYSSFFSVCTIAAAVNFVVCPVAFLVAPNQKRIEQSIQEFDFKIQQLSQGE